MFDAGEPGSAGLHKPGLSGATPEPATSARSGQARWLDRVRNWQSGKVENLVIL